MKRLDKNFYTASAPIVAPLLLGKYLVRKIDDTIYRYKITETEAYYGKKDTACHGRHGKTERNEAIFEEGGTSYVYMCYGLHFLFNVVTGPKGHPEAVLIRGVENYNGPAKLTKALKIDKSLNKTNLVTNDELWIEDNDEKIKYIKDKRIGIDYATLPYRNMKWRFILK